MSLFVWDAKYSVNISEIDRQHQTLFALFSELYEAMQQGHGNEVVGRVLTSVLDYTTYHFEYEENLLRQYGYADGAAHRAEHAKLAQQARTLERRFQDGQNHVTIATLKFLNDWLNDHILSSDRKLAAFLVAKGVR